MVGVKTHNLGIYESCRLVLLALDSRRRKALTSNNLRIQSQI